MFYPDEMEIAARMPSGTYEKLKKARIAVAGAGGLGSNIATALARCCVGELLIADFDRVEPSNLNRQYYTVNDIGEYKTEALKAHIKAINPYTTVNTVTQKITADNATKILGGYDIVCEALDAAEQKSMLVNTLLTGTERTILICGSGMSGTGGSNTVTTKKINNRLYICGDMHTSSDEGLIAPRVILCAMHQANLAAELIIRGDI